MAETDDREKDDVIDERDLEKLVAEVKALRRSNAALKRENAKARLENKQAEEDRAAELAEQGKWRELLEETQKALAVKEAEAEKAGEYLAVIEAANAAALDRLPEEMQVVYKAMPPLELQKHLPTIMAAHVPETAPDTGAGHSGAAAGGAEELTPEMRQIASANGMTQEEYLDSARRHGIL